MELENLSLLVKKFIEKTRKTDFKPGLSYIADRSLNISALRQLITTELKNINEIIELFYIVFFLYEGDDFEVAKFKAKNELYYIVIKEISDKDVSIRECETCYGSGRQECGECDDEGAIECYTCDGSGELEGVEGPEDCDRCDGSGNDYCDYCDGEGEIDCDECEGLGETRTDEDYVTLNTEYWIFYGDEIEREIKETIKSTGGVFDAYEILDKVKGSVMLLKTVSETDEVEITDFEEEYGIYEDVKDLNIFVVSYNLNTFDLSNKFNVIKWTNNYTIR